MRQGDEAGKTPGTFQENTDELTVSAGEADASENAPAPNSKPRLRISYAVAAVCAALILVAVGAGIMARYISSRPDEVRIFEDLSSGGASVRTAASSAPVSEKAAAASVSYVVTSAPAKTGSASETSAAEAFSFPADLNAASEEMLRSVPGINKDVAAGIINFRINRGNIHNYEQLLDIYGIGDRTLNVIKEYFYISESEYRPSVSSQVTVRTEPPASSSKVTVQTSAQSAAVSRTETSASAEPPAPKTPHTVNINTADAEELSEALLIDIELARKVVAHRELIGGFVDPREMMNVTEFSRELFASVFDYLRLSDDDLSGTDASA